MIVYENSLQTFIDNCINGVISCKVAEEMKKSGIGFSPNEERSWCESLPFIATVLNHESVANDINVAIEYQSQINRSRIDFLVYGKDEFDNDSMVIIELKQWSKVQLSNKPNYVLTHGGGGQITDYQHPSYQSLRYSAMLKGFNEYVQDNEVNINSCSYLHNMDNIYEEYINDFNIYPFLQYSPVYLKEDAEKLRNFVNKYVKKPSRILLYEIDNSKIRPSKYFANMLYNAIEGQPIFSLDDEQAASVSTIIYETNKAINENKRKTIIIKGGPGCGVPINTA